MITRHNNNSTSSLIELPKGKGKGGPNSEPIFDQVVGRAAFIDTLFVGINGEANADNLSNIRVILPSANQAYGRRAEGACPISGNPWVLRYCRIVPFKQVPLMQLQLRSELAPMTLEQVRATIAQVCSGPAGIRISRLEFTFDLPGLRPDELLPGIFTCSRSPARKVEVESTRYVGRPTSAWQVRLYPKPRYAPRVCRLEFILRRPFLRRTGIEKPEDIGALRGLDLSKVLTIRNLDTDALKAKIGSMTPKWKRDRILHRPGDLQDEERWLRRVVKVDTGPLFPLATVWRQILAMQQRFEW